MPKSKILAAGGVLMRGGVGGPEILLVYRNRYNDWSLPKGKLNAGENQEAAAVREVREETGYQVEIGPELGTVNYEVKGVSKEVRFWSMRVVGESHGIEDTGEVAEVAWLPLDVAIERLTYALEKDFVARAFAQRQ